MSNKQSSIEFLIKAFQGAYGDKVINVISEQVKQAKEMHKQEIKDAFECGEDDKFYTGIANSEEFYNTNFGK